MVVWLFPEPDSPTMAMVSPAFTSRSMPRTACTGPSCVSKVTFRSRTLKMVSLVISAILRVKAVAQAITKEVQCKQDDGQRRSRPDQLPARATHVLGSFRNQQPQRGEGILNTETKEGEETFQQNCLRHQKRDEHDDRAERIRDNVAG